ncbi:heat-inducible transcriptional repressor HrcA [Luteithermobacter gelatinilyticus]|uniref:heat-inducible transcriptional repressor HrcA n=1 Tax=Luteithermobacter gelatinilyticus TaxID=2582913 RepID=UPI001105F872|nr:heat-inducible transcriptional repressor HrcA [Luteithermobacter gelatinilyticus]|tara:strand:- start:3583 stop:4623 length:1041 start_codon:yes stop_codon:yes gene_type:complete
MLLEKLNDRSRDIFRRIVDTYLLTGDPVGSRTLSKQINPPLSPASIRNVMADLEESGLIYSPHTSAGRIPTEAGLRLFVDGLLEVGNLSEEERTTIRIKCHESGTRLEDVLDKATGLLSGLSHCASVVVAPKAERPLKHIEFVNLGSGRALVVLVSEGDDVENRIIEIPAGLTPSALIQAGNYLSTRMVGRTFSEARKIIEEELKQHKAELDALTQQVVEQGLAVRTSTDAHDEGTLIVRGQANLLENLEAMEDLEKIRLLFEDLETKKDLVNLLDLAREAEGVRIFIGSENKLFSLSGSSVIASPYMDANNNILGVIGVIGPTRLNYARIIPMVDYTAKVIGNIL